MTDFTNPSDIRASLEYLQRHGVKLSSVADIGGCTGEWTHVFRDVYKDVPVLLIEPQERYVEQLLQVQRDCAPVEYVQALVGESGKISVPFNVCDDRFGGGSSVRRERTNVPTHVIQLPMTTVDEIIRQRKFPWPELIKLDVQGYELEVLCGSPVMVEKAQVIMTEVSVWQYNQGCPLVGDVFTWMTNHGFVLFDLSEIHRLPGGMLNELDLVFVRQELKELRGKGPVNFAGWPPAPEDL